MTFRNIYATQDEYGERGHADLCVTAFLASEISSYIMDQFLRVDGGSAVW